MERVSAWASSGFVQTVAILLLPYAWRKGRIGLANYRRWRASPVKDPRSPSQWRIALLTALVTFGVGRALFYRPVNLFHLLDLPLNISPSTFQSTLARHVRLDEYYHRLLTKLGSVEGRAAYIRLGADPLLKCAFCRSYTEQVIFSLPPKLGVYTFIASLTGLLSSHAWQNTLALILISSFALELSLLLFADLFAFSRTAPLAIYLHIARHTLFIVLGVAAYVLREPLPEQNAIARAIDELALKQDLTNQRLKAALLQRLALTRDPSLREATNAAAQELNRQSEAAAKDTRAQAVAVRLGVNEGGEQRLELQRYVETVMSLPPPSHLTVTPAT